MTMVTSTRLTPGIATTTGILTITPMGLRTITLRATNIITGTMIPIIWTSFARSP